MSVIATIICSVIIIGFIFSIVVIVAILSNIDKILLKRSKEIMNVEEEEKEDETCFTLGKSK